MEGELALIPEVEAERDFRNAGLAICPQRRCSARSTRRRWFAIRHPRPTSKSGAQASSSHRAVAPMSGFGRVQTTRPHARDQIRFKLNDERVRASATPQQGTPGKHHRDRIRGRRPVPLYPLILILQLFSLRIFQVMLRVARRRYFQKVIAETNELSRAARSARRVTRTDQERRQRVLIRISIRSKAFLQL